MALYPNQYLKTYLTDWGLKVSPIDTVTVKSAFNKYYTFIFDIRGLVAPSHLCSVCHLRFNEQEVWEAGWELGCFCLESLPLSVHRASHLISAGLATWRRMTDENRVLTSAALRPIVVWKGDEEIDAVNGGSDDCGYADGFEHGLAGDAMLKVQIPATRPAGQPASPPPGLPATALPSRPPTPQPGHTESCEGRYEDSQLLVYIPTTLEDSEVWEPINVESEKEEEVSNADFAKGTKESGKLHFTAKTAKADQEFISISDNESEMNWSERRCNPVILYSW